MGVVSSKVETPSHLTVKFPFQKKKEGGPGGAPDKAHPSPPGFPFGEDEEGISVVSLSDEDESDNGDASASTDVEVPPLGRK